MNPNKGRFTDEQIAVNCLIILLRHKITHISLLDATEMSN